MMRVNGLKHIRRARKGMALATTAVLLPVLMLVMAFAVDIGLAQSAQSRLESAVHQAADAAVVRLPDEAGARQTASAVARLALADALTFGSAPVIEVRTESDVLEVNAQMTARAFFGRFAGREGYALAAQTRRTLVP